MKIVSFVGADGKPAFGQIEGEEIVQLAVGTATTLRAALAAGGLDGAHETGRHALSAVKLLPVVPDPGKILCVGLNYENHRKETGRAEAAHPAIFTRFADTLIAAGDPLVMPRESTDFDYEGELAIVIGRGGRRIARKDALSHVAGYACFNEGSVRDWQKHNIQFTPGKNFPGTGAFGPWMATPEEVPDLASQRVVTRLNGEVVQDQPIADMIWPVDEIIAYISTFTPLAPGDVIATGTPGGVGARRTPPLWMKPGDTVEVEIGLVGRLENRIIAED